MNRLQKTLTGAAVAILTGAILLECGIIAPGAALIVMGVFATITAGHV